MPRVTALESRRIALHTVSRLFYAYLIYRLAATKHFDEYKILYAVIAASLSGAVAAVNWIVSTQLQPLKDDNRNLHDDNRILRGEIDARFSEFKNEMRGEMRNGFTEIKELIRGIERANADFHARIAVVESKTSTDLHGRLSVVESKTK
jgi:hypothetical protein